MEVNKGDKEEWKNCSTQSIWYMWHIDIDIVDIDQQICHKYLIVTNVTFVWVSHSCQCVI